MKNENTTNPQAYTCTHVLNKKLQEFETWIKIMNYGLLLEHTHSDEYYKRNYIFRNSNKEKGHHEKTL